MCRKTGVSRTEGGQPVQNRGSRMIVRAVGPCPRKMQLESVPPVSGSLPFDWAGIDLPPQGRGVGEVVDLEPCPAGPRGLPQPSCESRGLSRPSVCARIWQKKRTRDRSGEQERRVHRELAHGGGVVRSRTVRFGSSGNGHRVPGEADPRTPRCSGPPHPGGTVTVRLVRDPPRLPGLEPDGTVRTKVPVSALSPGRTSTFRRQDRGFRDRVPGQPALAGPPAGPRNPRQRGEVAPGRPAGGDPSPPPAEHTRFQLSLRHRSDPSPPACLAAGANHSVSCPCPTRSRHMGRRYIPRRREHGSLRPVMNGQRSPGIVGV